MEKERNQTIFLTEQLLLFEKYVDSVVQDWLDNEPIKPSGLSESLRMFGVDLESDVFDSSRDEKGWTHGCDTAMIAGRRLMDKCNLLVNINLKESEVLNQIKDLKGIYGEEFFQYDTQKYEKRLR